MDTINKELEKEEILKPLIEYIDNLVDKQIAEKEDIGKLRVVVKESLINLKDNILERASIIINDKVNAVEKKMTEGITDVQAKVIWLISILFFLVIVLLIIVLVKLFTF